MTGRFPILTDSNVRQQIVEALLARGWDVVRAIDVCPEGTSDEVLFERASEEGRVFVTTDEGIQSIGRAWLRAGRPFRMIFWRQTQHKRMSDGEFLRRFEAMAEEADSFLYPIRFVVPE